MYSVAWWPTALVMAAATYTDLRYRRIPNWLVFPFLLAGFITSGWVGGWHGLQRSLLGFGLGLLIYGLLCALGGMGMGDVKLCAAVGSWVGPNQLFLALVLTGMVGGVMVFVWAVKDRFLGELFTNTGQVLAHWGKRGLAPDPELSLANPLARKMPYAPAIAIGTLVSFFAR